MIAQRARATAPARARGVAVGLPAVALPVLLLAAGCLPAPRAGTAAGAAAPYRDPRLAPEARAADLVRRLTVEEKIGQLMTAAPAIPRLGVPA